MNFDSQFFIYFFSIILVATWLAPHDVIRKFILLFASFIFYASWDWRFLSLLMVTSIVSFFGARLVTDCKNPFRVSIIIAFLLVPLATAKYFDFFSVSFVTLLHSAGINITPWLLNLTLPLGISFYTFQAISYVADVHTGKINLEKSFVNYTLYLCLFPHVVAGPIVRGSDLLPQLNSPWQAPDSAQVAQSLCRFIWGLFKKVYIADRLTLSLIDPVFANSSTASGGMLLLAMISFGVMIYADFSGYSDMAISLAGLLGYRFQENFFAPYTALSVREFWRKWHISLSTWIRDYIYIPLGGSHISPWRTNANVLISMTLCGLWHGAAWRFVAWGAWFGILLIIERLWPYKSQNRLSVLISWLYTQLVVYTGWLIFRAETSTDLKIFFSRIVSHPLERIPGTMFVFVVICIVIIYLEQFLIRVNQNLLIQIPTLSKIWLAIVTTLVISIIMFALDYGDLGGRNFVYFQF